MEELKQSRWVKVHERGQANYEAHDNIMDILIGEKRCRADVTYTVRSHKKAAHWLVKYLEAAGAAQVLHEIAGQIEAASENKSDIELENEEWVCQIAKMEKGIFKVQLVWTPSEPVTKKKPAKRTQKIKKVALEDEPKELFKVPKRYANRVNESYQTSKGYWIQLKNGWMNAGDSVIHAESSKAAIDILKSCTKG